MHKLYFLEHINYENYNWCYDKKSISVSFYFLNFFDDWTGK